MDGTTVGEGVGIRVGVGVGRALGEPVGADDGMIVGVKVGADEGDIVGVDEGASVGTKEGCDDGVRVGTADGYDDGSCVGEALGGIVYGVGAKLGWRVALALTSEPATYVTVWSNPLDKLDSKLSLFVAIALVILNTNWSDEPVVAVTEKETSEVTERSERVVDDDDTDDTKKFNNREDLIPMFEATND